MELCISEQCSLLRSRSRLLPLPHEPQVSIPLLLFCLPRRCEAFGALFHWVLIFGCLFYGKQESYLLLLLCLRGIYTIRCSGMKPLPFPFCFCRDDTCIWSAGGSGAIHTGGERLLKVLSRREQRSAAAAREELSSVERYRFYRPYSVLN